MGWGLLCGYCSQKISSWLAFIMRFYLKRIVTDVRGTCPQMSFSQFDMFKNNCEDLVVFYL